MNYPESQSHAARIKPDYTAAVLFWSRRPEATLRSVKIS